MPCILSANFDPDAAQEPAPSARVLAEEEFADAVRRALRDPPGLSDNPLVTSRLLRRQADGDPPVFAPVDLLSEAIDALRQEPGGRQLHRSVDRMYARPAASPGHAAEVSGVPFSTYRRHLPRGVEQATTRLWEWELRHPKP